MYNCFYLHNLSDIIFKLPTKKSFYKIKFLAEKILFKLSNIL
jgi:hypothetical protein